MSNNNEDIETQLSSLPELVSTALMEWRTATLERERLEAATYLKERIENPKKTIREIQAVLTSDEKIYQASLSEISAEGNYNFLYERLLSAKKRALLRTAF